MIELQLEGLVGPTHHYAGLSFGNVASATHAHSVSRPREAALQSLAKMKRVHDLGVPVAVMPPHPRPNYSVLNRLGIHGDPAAMLRDAEAESPTLTSAIWSASSMWTANAATVSASTDSADGRVHLTPANLFSTLHRSFEARYTHQLLQQIFADTQHFMVHDPLNVTTRLADEGAANHMRLIDTDGRGINVFVYGATPDSPHHPKQFPARQQRAASEDIAAQHHLPQQQTLYVQQSPDAIDAGVFHNDVIAMSHGSLLICHERAYVDQDAVLEQLQQRGVTVRVVREDELSLADAVKTYFFNAQLLELPDGGIHILFPQECAEHAQAKALCDGLHIMASHEFLNLRESMKNGGGPACLRLRVPLNEMELAAMHQGARFSERLYGRLGELITAEYPEQFTPDDLHDAALGERLLAVQAKIVGLLELK